VGRRCGDDTGSLSGGPEELMRVGIDAHMVGGHETGNETYVKGLVDGFTALADPDLELFAYHIGSAWTNSSRTAHFQKLLTGSPYVRLGAELPLRSLAQRLDVLHMTYGAPVWSAAPIVLTVHDICYATNPEWFSPRDLRVLSSVVPRSIRMAAHVITDSESARGEIIDHYHVPEEKISNIPIGAGAGAAPITLEEASRELGSLDLNLERPYLLTVGNLQPRKNLVRLVEAFNQLVGSGHDIDLVVVGPRHFRADEVFQAAQSAKGRTHLTGYVSDRQLAACYRCSTAFVLPSLYEGFGLPVIEAMSHGVPVACSNAGALPEVCGDAAVLFDPRSVEAIAAAVTRLLDDSNLRERLSRAGQTRAAQFSWKRTAELTLAAYRKAVGS
jgi:glycosyltransferase involved in cell wall biosynthesis